MRFSILCSILIAISVLWTEARADIAKADLKNNIEERINTILESKKALLKEPASQNAIQNLKMLSGTVEYFEGEMVHDGIALWLSDSIASILENRAEELLVSGSDSKSLLQSLTQQAQKRFPTINLKNSNKLIQDRDHILSSVQKLRGLLRKNIITLFEDYPMIAVKLGKSKFIADDFGSIAIALDDRVTSLLFTSAQDITQIDEMRYENSIESDILTLALVRSLNRLLLRIEKLDTFNFGNIFSRMFDVESLAFLSKMKTPEQAAQIVKVMILTNTANHNNLKIAMVDYSYLKKLLVHSDSALIGDEDILKKKASLSFENGLKENHILVVFVNNFAAWKALSN